MDSVLVFSRGPHGTQYVGEFFSDTEGAGTLYAVGADGMVEVDLFDLAPDAPVGDLYYPEPAAPTWVAVPSNVPLDSAGMPDVT